MRTNLTALTPVADVPRADCKATLDPTAALLGLFERLSLRERLVRVAHGLRQPPDSGEHKWAVIERQRLIGGVAAWVVPVLLALLLSLVASPPRVADPGVRVPVRPPDPVPPLDPIRKIEELPVPDVPPVDMDMGVDVPSDSLLEAISAPVTSEEPPDVHAAQTVSPMHLAISVGGPFGVRGPPGRWGKLKEEQAEFTDPAVLRALRWLKTQQESEGAWPQTRPAMTALATLAYLAYGQTTDSPEFGGTLERALRYLVDAQEENGRFRGRDGHDYTQPIAAYALAEAFGMLRLPQLKAPAEKAMQIVIDGQNAVGGFNYNLKGAADTRNDTTYTSWCVQALKAARIANLECQGLEACMQRAVDGVRRNFGAADGYGGFGYTGPDGGGTALSGAGVLCLQFLGDTKSREYREGILGLDQAVFAWENIPAGWSRSPLYYGYYITQARFQHGGESWRGWKDQFARTLVNHQTTVAAADSGYVDDEGKARDIGYWDSPSPSELTGGNGRIMDTILSTLMLEVYYRYLPTFGVTPTTPKSEPVGEPLVTVDVRFGAKR